MRQAVIYVIIVVACWGRDAVIVDQRLLWPVTGLLPLQPSMFGCALGVVYLLPLAIAAGNAVARTFL